MKNMCYECKKETSELYPHDIKIPNFVLKNNREPETDDELKEAMEGGISTIKIWICSECLDKYDSHLRSLHVKGQRKLFELNDGTKDMK